jgi:hypothetical protein
LKTSESELSNRYKTKSNLKESTPWWMKDEENNNNNNTKNKTLGAASSTSRSFIKQPKEEINKLDTTIEETKYKVKNEEKVAKPRLSLERKSTISSFQNGKN